MKRWGWLIVVAVLALAAPVAAQQDFDEYTVRERASGMQFLVKTADNTYVSISIEHLFSGVLSFPGPARSYWGAFADTDAELTDDYLMTSGASATSDTTTTLTTIVVPAHTPAADVQVARVGLLIPTAWLPLAEGYPRQQFGLPGPAWTTARTATISGVGYTLLTDSAHRLITTAAAASRTFVIRP